MKTPTQQEWAAYNTNDLYEMKPLEQMFMDCFEQSCMVTRVPGGWIFDFYHVPQNSSQPITDKCVFVPYSDEFKPTT